MEGKEVRFGIANSSLFTTITTDASCGAVNTMHDSLLPLGGMVPMINIMLGEIIFGGVGSGLYGMLLFAIVAVFVAGLMVGRTPEYLGKKIEAREVKMAMLAILILPLSILGFTALAVVLPTGPSASANAGPAWLQRSALCLHIGDCQQWQRLRRAFRQYAFLQSTLGLAMWIGRFCSSFRCSLSLGRSRPRSSCRPRPGHSRPTVALFVGLLIGVILIIGGLTFFPALALGPIEEHFAMTAGTLF